MQGVGRSPRKVPIVRKVYKETRRAAFKACGLELRSDDDLYSQAKVVQMQWVMAYFCFFGRANMYALFQNTNTSFWLFYVWPQKLHFRVLFQATVFFLCSPGQMVITQKRFLNLVCCFCRRRLGSFNHTNSVLSYVKVVLNFTRKLQTTLKPK